MKIFRGTKAHVIASRLRKLLIISILVVPIFARGADANYINNGIVTSAPQIDAINFINNGTFDIFSTAPFETSDTLNFTNNGTMIGALGWRLETVPSDTGVRRMAANFFNRNTATLEADDLGGVIVLGFPNIASVTPSHLWIRATNIVNQGLLSVGGNGWLQLVGTNVNLVRSGLEVQEITASGSINGVFTNFYIPDTGIYDLWWGQTNLNFNSSRIWNGSSATAPGHPVTSINGGFQESFTIQAPLISAYSNSVGITVQVTNIVGIPNPGPVITNVDATNIVISSIYVPTNMYKQAVFVGISDPSTLSAGVRYFPSTIITNPFKTVSVAIGFVKTNIITGTPEATTLFFYDTLASETNRGYFTNFSVGLTARPENYLLSRLDDGRFAGGAPGNSLPDPGFLYDPTTFSNAVVAGEYSGYGAFVDNLVSEPPNVVGGTVTNFPGRVQIYADSLDLTSTRIRGLGQVIVDTKHLVGSSNAVVDCQNLSYSLASTNGNLRVANLAQDSVARLKGNMLAWSGLWSNSMTLIYMNNYSISNIVDTNGTTIGMSATQAPLTNGGSVNLHTLLLDGELLTRLPVTTWDFDARSTNVVVDDNLTVVEGFLIQGQSFTLNGTITFSQATIDTSIGTVFSSSISDWVYTNAPNLLYFTNSGVLNLPGIGHFGDDGPVSYLTFVNNGLINAASILVKANSFRNGGNLQSQGIISIQGQSGFLLNGQSTSSGDTTLSCDTLKLSGYRLSVTNGALNLNVNSALSDAGPATPSQINVLNGFNLPTKPPMGDLLGTAFQSKTLDFAEADHVWAGQDQGVSPGGYLNNVALGKLILGPVGRGNPLLFFSGAGNQNGLYVDLLDLTALGTNYQQFLAIAPNLTIYYAAAKLGFTPPNGPSNIPQEPEEYLDGQFGGHLRWVSSFAGPNSSTTVVVGNQTVVVNAALRNSKIIDSDGDGIPNFYDTTPFGGSGGNGGTGTNGLALTASLAAPAQGKAKSLAITWTAAPSTVYRVEVATDLLHPNWQLLSLYTNNSVAAQTATVWDTNAPAATGMRFYRVGHSQ